MKKASLFLDFAEEAQSTSELRIVVSLCETLHVTLRFSAGKFSIFSVN